MQIFRNKVFVAILSLGQLETVVEEYGNRKRKPSKLDTNEY